MALRGALWRALCNPTASLVGPIRHATKAAAGASKNGRDSNAKYLGTKLFGGQVCKAGSVIVRQRGFRIHAGERVGAGRDHTLFALVPGYVHFSYDNRKKRKFAHVFPTRENPLKRPPRVRTAAPWGSE